jgi:hypothetical protein
MARTKTCTKMDASGLPLLAMLAVLAPVPAAAVGFTTGTVNGLAADIWTWTDSAGLARSLALKQEGHGNPGHGGYAIQLTYFVGAKKITVNAETGSDGGFGYFVSHERYRNFADGSTDTIAGHIFGKDDSPLGLGFPVTTSMPTVPAGSGAERFALTYGHYGTNFADPVNPNTGGDSTPLPAGQSNYSFYSLPVQITWVVQDGLDYPRIDNDISLAGVIQPGGSTPLADLLSFDMRGPYGVMVFDNGADGIVKNVLWADQEYRFALTGKPVTRDTGWKWSQRNKGARYQALQAGAFEMGLYEPSTLATTAIVDGYSPERGYTSASYAAGGGKSYSSCPSGQTQVLPSDGEWPYQSVQYSLPCGSTQFNAPTTGKKIAWGSTAYYGTSLTGVYNGRKTFPFDGFPAGQHLDYSVCLVVGKIVSGQSPTVVAASSYSLADPVADCATTQP